MNRVLLREKSVSRLIAMAVVMLAMLFLMAAKPAEAQGTGVHHIVQAGEYLSLIAKRYGTTTAAILAANPQITNPNLIYTGQTIFVPFSVQPPPAPPPPPPPAKPACRWNHYVTPGQTLLMISGFYGVNPYAVAQANGIFNLNLIFSGTTLCIP